MKKAYLKFIKQYLTFLSFIHPSLGGKLVIKFFQKVRLRKIKPRELPFYNKAITKTMETKKGKVNYYQLGNPNGEFVFLVHGWDSNAGSLSKFAFALAEKNYHVIALDLPAHAKSEGTHTNLFECKNALISLIKTIKPTAPFSIIGHSFGSAVSIYALAELNLPVRNIILLSANNILKVIFDDYQKLVGFNDKVYSEVKKWVKNTLNEDLDNLILTDGIKKVNYQNIMVIHDKFDKVISFQSALEIKERIPNTILAPFEKIGHYRMLWNDDVLEKTIDFLEK